MKIDMTKPIKNLIGVNLENPESKLKKKEPFTMRIVCTNSLLTPTQDDKNIDGNEKARRFELAMRVYTEDEIDLNVDELKLIKDLIGRLYSPLVVGRAYQILDPKEKPSDGLIK